MPGPDQPDRAHRPASTACAVPAPRRNPGRPHPAPRTLAARELLGPAGLLRIDLDGEIYTLRLTRNQRLILTK